MEAEIVEFPAALRWMVASRNLPPWMGTYLGIKNSRSPVYSTHPPSVLSPVGLRASQEKENLDYS